MIHPHSIYNSPFGLNEHTQEVINIFQALQVFFLGFHFNCIIARSLFVCSTFTTYMFDHKLGFPGCQYKVAGIHNIIQPSFWEGVSHQAQNQRWGPFSGLHGLTVQ